MVKIIVDTLGGDHGVGRRLSQILQRSCRNLSATRHIVVKEIVKGLMKGESVQDRSVFNHV